MISPLTVPYNDDLHPGGWIMDDPDIDLPKLLFCDGERVRGMG